MIHGLQDSWMRCFTPLPIGAIYDAAPYHQTMPTYVVIEGDTNLPLSPGRVNTGSTEQIYLVLKDGGAFSIANPLTNRFTCKLEGKKRVETPIKGIDGRWKAFWCIAGTK